MPNPGAWSFTDPTFNVIRNSKYTWSADYQVKPVTVSGNYGKTYSSKSRSGYRTPGYFDMVRKGVPIPPALATLDSEVLRFKSEASYSSKRIGLPAGQYFKAEYGPLWVDPTKVSTANSKEVLSVGLHTDAEVSLIKSDAIREFRKKVRGTAFDGLTFAGELGESVRMIADRSHAISNSIISRYSPGVLRKQQWYEPFLQSSYKRLRGIHVSQSDINKWINEKASYWLEGVYGWRPLINDMLSAAETAANYVERMPTSHSHLGGSEDNTSTATWQFIHVVFGDKLTVTCTRKDVVTFKRGASMTTSWRNPSTLEYALRTIGISWDNVLPAVWNLIPYSFVVDALTNSSDVIDALTLPTSGITYPWFVDVRESTINAVIHPLFSNSGLLASQWKWENVHIGETQRKAVKFSRGPSTQVLSVPSLTLRPPSMQSAVNLAVLAVSKITSFDSPFFR